jgi:hypothetical protein
MTGDFFNILYQQGIKSVLDLAPILVLIGLFQFGVIRKPIPHLARIVVGLAYVATGLTLFRIGLEESLIPIGRDMARQLVESAFATGDTVLSDYLPLLAFAGLIGFTATLIEPTLIAAAGRVQALSGGALKARMLQVVISCGVALGLVLGTLRIVNDFPLAYLLAGISISLILLALTAPREIVPLALDSGGIATSVVTVPLIAAYGVAVAEAMPTAATAADGFGLIVLALLSPVVLLLALAQFQARSMNRANTGGSDAV